MEKIKLVEESLNEFLNPFRRKKKDTYANHVIKATGFPEMDPSDPDYDLFKGVVKAIEKNRDLLALADELKNSGVDWTWEDLDDHNVAGDQWIEEEIADREDVKRFMYDVLIGLSEMLNDGGHPVDADPFIETLSQMT